jgi:tellurite resistance protein TerC
VAVYFALAGIGSRFVYFKYALSLVLAVGGDKMIANSIYGGKFVPTELALLIGGVNVLSLVRSPSSAVAAEPTALPTGWDSREPGPTTPEVTESGP